MCEHAKERLEAHSWSSTCSSCKFHITVACVVAALSACFYSVCWNGSLDSPGDHSFILIRSHQAIVMLGYLLSTFSGIIVLLLLGNKCLFNIHVQVVRCLLIEPFPESALNEEAGKMLMEDYEGYAKHARYLFCSALFYLFVYICVHCLDLVLHMVLCLSTRARMCMIVFLEN